MTEQNKINTATHQGIKMSLRVNVTSLNEWQTLHVYYTVSGGFISNQFENFSKENIKSIF